MKHRIRINGEIKEIDCDFGTDVTDKHGSEIFEGDIIKVDFPAIRARWESKKLFKRFPCIAIGEVNFGNGKFEVYFHQTNFYRFSSDWLYLWELRDNREFLEIVGRADD